MTSLGFLRDKLGLRGASWSDVSSDDDDEEDGLEKDLTPADSMLQDGSDSDADDRDFAPRRRLLASVVATLAAAGLISALLCHAARARAAGGHRAQEPLPGVTLQPSDHMLPALPSMPSAAAPATMPAAGASEPSAARTLRPRVVFGMLIKNMDYSKLVDHENLLSAFNATVKQAVSNTAGFSYGPEDVELQLSAGSVVVECTVRAPSQAEATAVQSALTSSSKLTSELSLNIEALVMADVFQAVSTGRISVSKMSTPVIRGTLPPTTTTTVLTSATPSTSRPPPTTTTRNCKSEGSSCFVPVQCCSGRCLSDHRCGTPMDMHFR